MVVHVEEDWFAIESDQKLYTISRGDGLPVVFCNGIGVSSESFWPPVCRPLAERVRTIGWDYLGHGHSSSALDPTTLTIRGCAEQLARVLDYWEIEAAVMAGHSMGAQVCFEFYRLFPERTLGLIPTLGTYEHPFNNFMRFSRSSELFEHISLTLLRHPTLVETIWPHLFNSMIAQPLSRFVGLVHPTLCSRRELDIYLSHLRTLSPFSFVHLARDMQLHSAADVLPFIEVPTLILAGEHDVFTPIEASHDMQAMIPNAEMLVVREGTHAALAEQPELFWLRIERFLSLHFPEQVRGGVAQLSS